MSYLNGLRRKTSTAYPAGKQSKISPETKVKSGISRKGKIIQLYKRFLSFFKLKSLVQETSITERDIKIDESTKTELGIKPQAESTKTERAIKQHVDLTVKLQAALNSESLRDLHFNFVIVQKLICKTDISPEEQFLIDATVSFFDSNQDLKDQAAYDKKCGFEMVLHKLKFSLGVDSQVFVKMLATLSKQQKSKKYLLQEAKEAKAAKEDTKAMGDNASDDLIRKLESECKTLEVLSNNVQAMYDLKVKNPKDTNSYMQNLMLLLGLTPSPNINLDGDISAEDQKTIKLLTQWIEIHRKPFFMTRPPHTRVMNTLIEEYDNISTEIQKTRIERLTQMIASESVASTPSVSKNNALPGINTNLISSDNLDAINTRLESEKTKKTALLEQLKTEKEELIAASKKSKSKPSDQKTHQDLLAVKQKEVNQLIDKIDSLQKELDIFSAITPRLLEIKGSGLSDLEVTQDIMDRLGFVQKGVDHKDQGDRYSEEQIKLAVNWINAINYCCQVVAPDRDNDSQSTQLFDAIEGANNAYQALQDEKKAEHLAIRRTIEIGLRSPDSQKLYPTFKRILSVLSQLEKISPKYLSKCENLEWYSHILNRTVNYINSHRAEKQQQAYEAELKNELKALDLSLKTPIGNKQLLAVKQRLESAITQTQNQDDKALLKKILFNLTSLIEFRGSAKDEVLDTKTWMLLAGFKPAKHIDLKSGYEALDSEDQKIMLALHKWFAETQALYSYLYSKKSTDQDISVLKQHDGNIHSITENNKREVNADLTISVQDDLIQPNSGMPWENLEDTLIMSLSCPELESCHQAIRIVKNLISSLKEKNIDAQKLTESQLRLINATLEMIRTIPDQTIQNNYHQTYGSELAIQRVDSQLNNTQHLSNIKSKIEKEESFSSGQTKEILHKASEQISQLIAIADSQETDAIKTNQLLALFGLQPMDNRGLKTPVNQLTVEDQKKLQLLSDLLSMQMSPYESFKITQEGSVNVKLIEQSIIDIKNRLAQDDTDRVETDSVSSNEQDITTESIVDQKKYEKLKAYLKTPLHAMEGLQRNYQQSIHSANRNGLEQEQKQALIEALAQINKLIAIKKLSQNESEYLINLMLSLGISTQEPIPLNQAAPSLSLENLDLLNAWFEMHALLQDTVIKTPIASKKAMDTFKNTELKIMGKIQSNRQQVKSSLPVPVLTGAGGYLKTRNLLTLAANSTELSQYRTHFEWVDSLIDNLTTQEIELLESNQIATDDPMSKKIAFINKTILFICSDRNEHQIKRYLSDYLAFIGNAPDIMLSKRDKEQQMIQIKKINDLKAKLEALNHLMSIPRRMNTLDSVSSNIDKDEGASFASSNDKKSSIMTVSDSDKKKSKKQLALSKKLDAKRKQEETMIKDQYKTFEQMKAELNHSIASVEHKLKLFIIQEDPVKDEAKPDGTEVKSSEGEVKTKLPDYSKALPSTVRESLKKTSQWYQSVLYSQYNADVELINAQQKKLFQYLDQIDIRQPSQDTYL